MRALGRFFVFSDLFFFGLPALYIISSIDVISRFLFYTLFLVCFLWNKNTTLFSPNFANSIDSVDDSTDLCIYTEWPSVSKNNSDMYLSTVRVCSSLSCCCCLMCCFGVLVLVTLVLMLLLLLLPAPTVPTAAAVTAAAGAAAAAAAATAVMLLTLLLLCLKIDAVFFVLRFLIFMGK